MNRKWLAALAFGVVLCLACGKGQAPQSPADSKVTLNGKNYPLWSVLDDIAHQADCVVQSKTGIGAEPVTLFMKDKALGDVLDALGEAHGLTWTIDARELGCDLWVESVTGKLQASDAQGHEGRMVSLTAKGVTLKEVLLKLSALAGCKPMFVGTNKYDELVSVDIKRLPLGQALDSVNFGGRFTWEVDSGPIGCNLWLVQAESATKAVTP